MSVRLMSLVFGLPPSVTSTQRVVLLKLADCADDEGRNCFPSVATIARAAGIGERAVQKVLRQLERDGLIAVQEAARRYRSTTYRLLLPEVNVASSVRGDTRFTPGANSRSGRGEVTFASGANGGSPDPSMDPSVDPFVDPSEGAVVRSFVGLWNAVTDGKLSGCHGVSETRKKHILRRLKERGIDDWRDVFARIATSEFCCGANGRGWKADFDWVIGSPDVAIKVLEGRYDNRAKPKQVTGGRTGASAGKYAALGGER